MSNFAAVSRECVWSAGLISAGTFSSPPRALVATELGCIERRFSLAIACRLLLDFASQFCAAYVPPRPAVSAL